MARDENDGTVTLTIPPLGESITEAVIGVWLKNVGDYVELDEPLVDLETDKITVQLPAPAAGVLVEQRAAVGDTVLVAGVVGLLDPSAERPSGQPSGQIAPPAAPAPAPTAVAAPAPAPAPAVTSAPEAPVEPDADRLRRATPAQRRALRLGHETEHETGHAADARTDRKPAAIGAASVRAPLAPANEVREQVVPMSPMRRRIAQRLVQAQTESASLTTFNEVDMSAVMALRSQFKQTFLDTHGVKLGFMSFFAKACAAACKLYPGINAEIRDDAIVFKKHYDFGVAVSTKRGLVVPVLRDVDRLSFAEIESGIIDLAVKARDGKLTLDDLTGGTFTITNGGVFGSMLSTPLLNYPQTGILGMHNIVKRPVAIDDRVEVRPVMYIALTYDHRVVDGRQAVRFLVAVKERVEHPERLLFDL